MRYYPHLSHDAFMDVEKTFVYHKEYQFDIHSLFFLFILQKELMPISTEEKYSRRVLLKITYLYLPQICVSF